MTTEIPSDPKVIAQAVRVLLEVTRTLDGLEQALVNQGGDLMRVRSVVRDVKSELFLLCITAPKVRIAVFPVDEKGGNQ